MKKIKLFFAIILSALCLLIPFAGCSATSNYKVDFDYTIEYSTSSWSDDIGCSLKGKMEITLPHAPAHSYYEISYTLNVYENGLIITKARMTENFSIWGEGGTAKIEFSKNIGKNIEKEKIKAKITNIEITEIKKSNKKHDYTPYAIGFGVTAGVILIGVIVVFILDKKGILFKRK